MCGSSEGGYCLFGREEWHWQTLPEGLGGQAGGDARHRTAAVGGQVCPLLLHLVADMEKSFSWPRVEEGWTLSTCIYSWLLPCCWSSSHVSNCFCTQDVWKPKSLISSLITSKAIACFSSSLCNLSYLFSISASEVCSILCVFVRGDRVGPDGSREKWCGNKWFFYSGCRLM